jgi:hypothetical protein
VKIPRKPEKKGPCAVQGLWGGMIGGTLIQTLALIWITLRTDWNKEVILSHRKFPWLPCRVTDRWSSNPPRVPMCSSSSICSVIPSKLRLLLCGHFFSVFCFFFSCAVVYLFFFSLFLVSECRSKKRGKDWISGTTQGSLLSQARSDG